MTEREEHPVDYLAELALGVLQPVEAEPIRAHLAGCESCRAEFGEMVRVARLLPAATDDLEPGPELRESVLSRIAVEPREPRELRPGAGTVIRPRRWQWAGAAAAGVAAIAVAAGAGGYAVRGGGREVADLEHRAALQAEVVDSAARGDLRVARGQQGDIRAAVVRAPGAKEAYLLAEGMPALPGGKAYQGWYTHDGKTFEPSAVFTDSAGRAWLPANEAVDGYAAFGLTIEDKDGAATPSSAPFVVVDLSKTVRVR